jgi:hypothetical protein
MASHKVTIKEVGGVFEVDMRKLHTKGGNTVVFHNDTDDPIAIFFPENDLFLGFAEQYNVIEVPAKASSIAYTVQGGQKGKKDNHYAYAVYCHTTGEFAIANSNPVIIIDH